MNATNATNESLPFVSDLSKTGWVATYPFKEYMDNQNETSSPDVQVCPESTPFYDGDSCIACDSQVFNVDTSQCEDCPAGTTYNKELKKCALDNANYTTNPYDPENLIYSGYSKGEIDYLYTEEKKNNPDIQDCTDPTPYFNGIKCVACPDDYPYFDIVNKDCVFCDSSSTYDKDLK